MNFEVSKSSSRLVSSAVGGWKFVRFWGRSVGVCFFFLGWGWRGGFGVFREELFFFVFFFWLLRGFRWFNGTAGVDFGIVCVGMEWKKHGSGPETGLSRL